MKNKKILFLTIIILLFITAISDVKAKDYALSEEFATGDVEAIPDYAYVFGSYLFIEDSSRSDLNLVKASRSAYADDMFMAFYGEYYPTYGFAENNAIYDRGNIICIDHIDGERIDDDCPGSGGGGGTTPSGESFDVRFFYLDANNHPVQIGGKKTIPSGGYLNVAAVPDTTNYQKPGYRIDGWFNVENTNDFSEEENVKFDFGQAVESNLNLIIRLVPLNYTITYDFNGGILDNGANQYPANTVNCDVTDQLVGNCTTYQEVPHKDGYIFKGWSVGESGKTDQVLVNANESLVDFLVPDVNGNNSVTLYACWEAQNYTIKYMLNGGTVLTGQLEGLYNVENHIDLTNSSNKPTRAGYTFAGWCATDSQDCTNFVTTTSGYHSTLTLYAKWNPISITVKYINGASSSTRACNYGDCTVNYNNPTKAGYDFLYWEGSDGNIYRKNDPIHTTNSSITLTAKFNEGNYFEIEYNLGDDEAFDAQPITMYQYNAEGTDINLPTPIKKGFNFSKWSIVNTSTGSGTINVDNNTLSVRSAGKIVLKPTYEEKSYSVYYKYYHNGTMTEPIEIDECKYLSCSAPNISEQYNGLSIKNWNGTDGRTYAQGSRIMEPVDGLVLTAVYGVESGHSIKFYDGNQQYSGYITTFSSDYAFHLPVPTKTGYRFEGWKTKGQTANTPNYGTFINVNTVNDDLELEAIWTPIKVTVRYDLNYAGAQNNNHTEECNLYDTNCLITYVPDTREGYEFLGWSLTNSTSQLLGVNSDLLGLFNNPTTVMLHAIWKTLDYPVIYDLDGGHFDVDELNSITYFVNLDNPDIHMKKPFKEGYTFKAWVPTNAVVDGNEDATISSAGNVKLTATWTPNALSVNFKVDGRVVHGQVSSECNYDGCTILTSDPTKPGYEFEYWKVEDTGYTYKKNDTIVGFAGTITLEAVFNDGNTLTINYDENGGTFGDYTPIRKYVVGVGTDLPIPTKTGFTFAGWIVLDARGRETNEIIYKIDSDKTTNISLKAKWTIEGYEVKTVSHLGTTVTSTNFGQPFTFPEAPTKPDVYHTFAGWKEAVDNGQTYQAGDSIVVNSPHTYVATWDLTTQFSIGYNLNGGNYGEHHPYYYALNSNNVIISEPEKDGYRFTGWSDVLEHATVDEDGILHITGNPGNIELEAHWYQTRYNIAYNYDGGTGTNPETFDLDLNNSATINLQEPTREGYRFDGWLVSGANATVNGNTITVSVPQGDQQTDLAVTAKWIQEVFNITYDYDGGTATNAATITLDQQNNGTLQLNVPTKTGYEFVNWTVLSGTATVENNILTVADAGDIALKANYRQVVFNITYDYFGGTITGTNPTTYEADSFESVVITAPNKDYYQFAGWTTDNPNISVSTSGHLRIEGNPTDIKLTATYNPRQFNVTYVEKENNEVVTTYGSHTCTFGVACDIQVTSPTKADRDFKYWKSDVGTIYPAGSKIFALTDMELTAEWDSVHTYTITYNLRGGEFTGNVIRVYNHGDTVSLPTAEFVSKTGYVFTKWSETESCDADPVTQITEGTENKEFYACYNANNYAINYYTDNTFTEVYDSNSGEYAYGTSHTVPTYVSSDMDKVFIHWKGNNNRIYLPGETIVVTEAINLYPEFYTVIHDEPPVTHSITYNFNGGNDPIGGSLVGRYTEGDTFELGSITRDGYTFAGWYDEEDNLVTSVVGKTSDLVLHATWTATRYTINFYVGSELVETKTLNHGESYSKHHYLDAQSADATAINADTGEEAYYFASGWAYYGSNEVVFPYEYDFGELITSNSVVNLSAVIDPDEEFVNVNMSGYFKDQEGNIHSSGIGTVGLFKYDTQIIALNANLDEGWYKDNEFQYPINSQSTLNATNFDLQLAVPNPEFPQLKYFTEIFNLEYLEVTEYHVSFSVDGVADYGDFECSYDDEYCDLSSVQTPTKEGFEFLGWQSNVPGLTYNEHFVYDSLEHIYIDFTPIWGISNYTINFYDGETLIESMTYTYGVQNNMGSVTEVNRGTENSPEIYFIEGWATEANSTDVAYATDYDFTHFVTINEVNNLYAIIDPNADYVGITWGIDDVNQDGISYHLGYGSVSFFKYGEELDLSRISDETWYSNSNYTDEIVSGSVLDERYYPFIESCSDAEHPQVTMCGSIYAKNVVQSLDSYTINFYDFDNETIKKSVPITYMDESSYLGINNSLPEVNGVSGWATYPDDEYYLYEYDYLYDFTKVATIEDEVNLYPISNPNDNLVDVTYHVYYSYPDNTVSPNEQETGHFQLRFNDMVNKYLLDSYFGNDALYYKISDVSADQYQVDFTQPLDNNSWYVTSSVNQDYPNVKYTADVYIKVPMEDRFSVTLTGTRNYNTSLDGTLELDMYKGQLIDTELEIPRIGNGNPHKISEYTWYLDQDKTKQVNLNNLPITEDLQLYGYR